MRQSDKQKFRELIVLLCAIAASVGIFASCKTPEIPDINPFPTTTTTTQPDVDLSGYEVVGSFDPRHAKVTQKTLSASIGPWGGDGGPFAIMTLEKALPWGTTDGHCNGEFCVVWGNKTGYFDYLPNGLTTHKARIQHIIDGYGGPAAGEKVGFFPLSPDGSERGSVAWTEWP